MKRSLGSLPALLVVPAVCLAQPRNIDWHVGASGGGSAIGGTLQIDGSISQTAVGLALGNGNTVGQGFWLAGDRGGSAVESDWNVMGAGGGAGSGGSVMLDGTVGQTPAGAIAGTEMKIGEGFWYGVRFGLASKILVEDPPAADGTALPPAGMAKRERAARLDVTPNPVGSTATVTWYVPRDGAIRIELYDALGSRAATLLEGSVIAGGGGLRLEAAGLPSGTYYLRLSTGNETVSRTVKIVR